MKAILSILGWRTNAFPTSPKPVKTYKTPGGNPASIANYAICNAVKGVYSAGFKIPTQPAAKRGPHFQHYINNGKFHGII